MRRDALKKSRVRKQPNLGDQFVDVAEDHDVGVEGHDGAVLGQQKEPQLVPAHPKGRAHGSEFGGIRREPEGRGVAPAAADLEQRARERERGRPRARCEMICNSEQRMASNTGM